jgi:hypothetical protein
MGEVQVFILKMTENITKHIDLGSFLQTILWILFISAILIIYREKIKVLLEIIVYRVREGCFIKIGPIIIGKGLNFLPSLNNMQSDIKVSIDDGQREVLRRQKYGDNKGLFIAHILRPSAIERYWNIYIYLIRHKSKSFSDIKYVEFFFGHKWGNKIYTIENKNKNKLIGIITSAYGPFLCSCRVQFKDGSKYDLYKYIDFEMK